MTEISADPGKNWRKKGLWKLVSPKEQADIPGGCHLFKYKNFYVSRYKLSFYFSLKRCRPLKGRQSCFYFLCAGEAGGAMRGRKRGLASITWA
ncbi:hypothetical protein [Paenibacillus rhizoplanae]|uniref:Uncharacterized protein n=2 Tax=Paenibacillus TaxID=44249 RepID=A0ABW5FCI7_9BACL